MVSLVCSFDAVLNKIKKSCENSYLKTKIGIPCQEAFPAALAACSRTNNVTVPHQDSAYWTNIGIRLQLAAQKMIIWMFFLQKLREIIVGL